MRNFFPFVLLLVLQSLFIGLSVVVAASSGWQVKEIVLITCTVSAWSVVLALALRELRRESRRR